MSGNDNRVLTYLIERGASSASKLSAELDMPNRTVRNALNRLIAAGFVISVGRGKSTEYKLVDCD